jgi:steroid delta-isomerase-like uncharacterized protein
MKHVLHLLMYRAGRKPGYQRREYPMRIILSGALLCTLCLPAMAASEQESNKAVARSFFEDVLDQGRLDQYAQSHANDFVVHTAAGDAPLAADRAAAAEERKALPDMRTTINQMLAERDMVAVYWTASGTNTGDGMGFHATGKRISVPGMTIFRFKAGKISEEWSVFDMSSAVRQAGLCRP